MSNIPEKNETSADTAWHDAILTCIQYLCQKTGIEFGVGAFIGDAISDDKCNLFVFILSGGGIQNQNWGCASPGIRYVVDGHLIGQYAKYEDAITIAQRVINHMPAIEDDTNEGQDTYENYMKGRGIRPNIAMMRLTTHPTISSKLINTGENTEKRVWNIGISFEVEYNNNKA